MLKLLGAAAVLAITAGMAQAQDAPAADQPNILVIFGDDIGQTKSVDLLQGADGLPHAQHRPDRQ